MKKLSLGDWVFFDGPTRRNFYIVEKILKFKKGTSLRLRCAYNPLKLIFVHTYKPNGARIHTPSKIEIRVSKLIFNNYPWEYPRKRSLYDKFVICFKAIVNLWLRAINLEEI